MNSFFRMFKVVLLIACSYAAIPLELLSLEQGGRQEAARPSNELKAREAESMRIRRMVMDAFNSMKTDNSSPSTSETVAKAFEIFPELQTMHGNVAYIARRIGKYHPEFGMEEMNFLDNCRKRPTCVGDRAVREFKLRFPGSTHSEALIVEALKRLGPRDLRGRRPRVGSLKIRRLVVDELNALQARNPGIYIATKYIIERIKRNHAELGISDDYLYRLISESRRYSKTMPFEQSALLGILSKKGGMNADKALAEFTRRFPTHSLPDHAVKEAFTRIAQRRP
jgi:hypothetical protein